LILGPGYITVKGKTVLFKVRRMKAFTILILIQTKNGLVGIDVAPLVLASERRGWGETGLDGIPRDSSHSRKHQIIHPFRCSRNAGVWRAYSNLPSISLSLYYLSFGLPPSAISYSRNSR
jgi:hypothetical protein